MIDHFNLPVSDLAGSRRFYERVLGPLGFRSLMRDGDAVGFGVDTWAFGIVATPRPIPKLHLAFRADSRDAVDHFFREAIDAGGQPNGLPGIRAAYDPAYYAAFVIDPDGHNIEAVCRGAVTTHSRTELSRGP
jgi:catechol 2,3-dioxygenase-like lactoylglutathione lyase family enzyme